MASVKTNVFTMGVVNVNNSKFEKAGWSASSCPAPSAIELSELTFEQVKNFQTVVRPNGKTLAAKSYTQKMFDFDSSNPETFTCSRCDGDGEYYDYDVDKHVDCKNCGGTGFVKFN